MCLQVYTRFSACGCELKHDFQPCRWGPAHRRCLFTDEEVLDSMDDLCQYHEYWSTRTSPFPLQSLPEPYGHRPVRSGATLWPLEGQMSVKAWAPAYYAEICRREQLLYGDADAASTESVSPPRSDAASS